MTIVTLYRTFWQHDATQYKMLMLLLTKMSLSYLSTCHLNSYHILHTGHIRLLRLSINTAGYYPNQFCHEDQLNLRWLSLNCTRLREKQVEFMTHTFFCKSAWIYKICQLKSCSQQLEGVQFCSVRCEEFHFR